MSDSEPKTWLEALDRMAIRAEAEIEALSTFRKIIKSNPHWLEEEPALIPLLEPSEIPTDEKAERAEAEINALLASRKILKSKPR